jgi:hypothetical protein
MKLKLDENLSALGKSLLEKGGHDVMTVDEQQMSGAQDERIYEVCRDEGRVLVTLDHDFGHTLRFPPEVTAGIVVSGGQVDKIFLSISYVYVKQKVGGRSSVAEHQLPKLNIFHLISMVCATLGTD